MAFNFNAVEETEAIKLPEMLEKGVFKNQTDLIDPLRLKELTTLVIGAGSVGSNLIHTMNKFGFSSFQVYDYDIWEEHNSASSIYPFKEATVIKPRCARSYDTWYYYPMNTFVNELDPTIEESITQPSYSLFKVDLLETEIKRNDPNLYFEKYRMPFGESMVNAFTKFNQSVTKMGARTDFTNEGLARRSSQLKFDWNPRVKPDLMVLTTDSLVSRAKCVWYMRELLLNNDKYKHEGEFPVIDTRTLDTTKGEILIFDLLDNDQVFDWFNYSIPVNKREKDFETLESKITDLDQIELIPFIDGTPNQCGNKMSVIISNQIGLMTTNLIVSLFSGKFTFEEIPKLYLLNTNPFTPYISKMELLLNE